MTSPPLALPAPTFRQRTGLLDLDTTARYAKTVAATWVPRIIVAGPMGRGESCTEEERAELLDVWRSYVNPRRLIAACWTSGDVDAAQAQHVQPLVMLQTHCSEHLKRELGAAPAGVWIYANPRYSSITLTPTDIPEHVAGVKLSKTSLAEIQAMRAAHPRLVIVHGSSRHIRASVAAGADLVTASPLAVLPDSFPLSSDTGVVQRQIDVVQRQIDTRDGHDARVDAVTNQARNSL